MTKGYTLGPWYYEEGHTDSYCVADLGKFKIYADELKHEIEAIEADARLIACAPELLEALEIATNYVVLASDLSYGQQAIMLESKAKGFKALIAKAKGE